MDCMELMRSLPDKFFDLAIADPPYGSDNSAQLNGGGDFREFNSTNPMLPHRRNLGGQIWTRN